MIAVDKEREAQLRRTRGSRGAIYSVTHRVLIAVVGIAWTLGANAQSMEACPLMTAVLQEAHADLSALQKELGVKSHKVITTERTADGKPEYEVHSIEYQNRSRLVWRRILVEGGLTLVDEIWIQSPGIRLSNGIAVGDTEESVKKMLGAPWKSSLSDMVYSCDTILLTVALERRRVTSIHWEFNF